MKQVVSIKGQRDGIGVYIDKNTDFRLVLIELRRKVSQSRDFFEGASTDVFFHGRELSKQEELALIQIIISETNMNASFVQPAANDEMPQQPAAHNNSEQQTSDVPIPNDSGNGNGEEKPINITQTDREGRTYMESPTAYYHTNLRSGQSINYPGSVVVLGDINPGSEVVAGGNITILGSLKGMAHAGADGDDNCTVTALLFEPTQIRIGKAISYVKPKEKGKNQTPSCAYARGGVVYIGAI